tara:strand:+ start:4120 stop:4401 length:282 start_codon:yes stop_codon:yes gene_type:complete
MSGDNLHGEQPDIRYNVKVHHHEEWEAMSLSERMEVLLPRLNKWEFEYLKENKNKLSKQQIELLEGRDIKSHEGMIYGQMYNDWKNQKGFKLK